MPGMDGVPLAEDDGDAAPWCMPGLDESDESFDEPQAAIVSASTAAVPAAARPRRRRVKREVNDITESLREMRAAPARGGSGRMARSPYDGRGKVLSHARCAHP
ncbi:hypothetical protein GCM10010211_81790 [Streptomyces albospinus]|uniref:Uncharacterized protein n=1 Tax=Streptomyces albospinus TaxID=285515 RepID=A0ABQ2VP58_9ACTN|nr:hypothetical protein GCM10010211_81790 [Streptomyces albospinus]